MAIDSFLHSSLYVVSICNCSLFVMLLDSCFLRANVWLAKQRNNHKQFENNIYSRQSRRRLCTLCSCVKDLFILFADFFPLKLSACIFFFFLYCIGNKSTSLNYLCSSVIYKFRRICFWYSMSQSVVNCFVHPWKIFFWLCPW